MELLFILSALAVVVVPSLYAYVANIAPTSFPTLRNKRICLLIAHPDDEAMFFSPTVLALTRPSTGNHVKILCLSTGNADGLGETRKKELIKSGMQLGLKEEDDVFVIDSPDFPDSMTKTWDTQNISSLLGSAFAPHLNSPRKNSDVPSVNIDVLITFDACGISSHPNHISLYHGARAFITSLLDAAETSPVDLYTLPSIGFLRKYTSIVDIFTTLANWWTAGLGDRSGERQKHPEGLLFATPLTGETSVSTAWKAMTEAHKSQMVWFRYGWITLSRYMVINDLRLEKVKKK